MSIAARPLRTRIMTLSIVCWMSFGAFMFLTTNLQAQPSDDQKTAMTAADSVKGWVSSAEAGLAATQAAYSNSWVGGEAGSFSWAATFRGDATRKLSSAMRFRSTLKLQFGQTLSQITDDQGETSWQKPRKSTDLIDWENLGWFDWNGFADPYIALRVESRFVDESVVGFRRFFTPTLLTESGGFQKIFIEKPKELEFRSRLGFALRQTITDVVIDAAARQSKRTTTSDGGIESISDFFLKLSDKMTYNSKLGLFKALFASNEIKGLNSDWKNIDANWEHSVTASLSKVLQTSLYVQLLYDKQITDQVRIKQTLGMGMTFKLK